MRRVVPSLLVCLTLLAGTAHAQQVTPIVHVLENGMKFLLLPRTGDPNIAAGWVAKVGSVHERPGITGVAHLFEHMMFKGTRTIGTRDIDEDLRVIAYLDELKAKIRKYDEELIHRQRQGLLDDWKNPEHRSEEHARLMDDFTTALAEQKSLLVKDEFDRIYTQAGGSSMNATTSYDFTMYFINVPANKLELWFWMESDRLANPVFREFYSERDVVHEERRLRIDSTPTGLLNEQFNALFWESSPYSWPVVGWTSDLEGLTRQEALDFFDVYYAPNNLTAAIVGDFDPDEAIRLAELYFERLERNDPPDPVRTSEVEQQAEKRMTGYAETTPQVSIRFHTVADGHQDEPALLVLGQILSGRTGRLFKSLVEGQEVATQAAGGQSGLLYDGYFQLAGVARDEHTPEEVEAALYAEIDKLKEEPVGQQELQKVKNQNAASAFRQLQSSFGLMFRLLAFESNNGWESINTGNAKMAAVTADDIQRVANKYFDPGNRSAAIYYRKQGDEPEDPRLAGLDPQEKQQIQGIQQRLAQASEDQIGMLQQQLAQFESMAAQVPEENQDMFQLMIELVRERIAELEEGGQQ